MLSCILHGVPNPLTVAHVLFSRYHSTLWTSSINGLFIDDPSKIITLVAFPDIPQNIYISKKLILPFSVIDLLQDKVDK